MDLGVGLQWLPKPVLSAAISPIVTHDHQISSLMSIGR